MHFNRFPNHAVHAGVGSVSGAIFHDLNCNMTDLPRYAFFSNFERRKKRPPSNTSFYRHFSIFRCRYILVLIPLGRDAVCCKVWILWVRPLRRVHHFSRSSLTSLFFFSIFLCSNAATFNLCSSCLKKFPDGNVPQEVVDEGAKQLEATNAAFFFSNATGSAPNRRTSPLDFPAQYISF
jgi:hypothetical protein